MTSKIALVTGAGSGIGRNAALSLAADGWTVIGTGRRQEALDETVSMGSGIEGVTSDVTDEASIDALFHTILERHGQLDLVFNNASNNVPSTNFGELSLEQFRHVVDVNLIGAFLVAQRAFAMMRDQSPPGGRIINNGSISATTPRYGSAPYTASKHAITGLTKSIALDGRALGISCGQIDIGNAASDMTSKMSGGVPQADGTLAAEPTMAVENVGSTIVHMANLPPDAGILTVTVMANGMPFVGRG